MSTNLGQQSDAKGDCGDYALAGPCGTCGFTPAELSPSMATEALLTFPGKWRSALAVELDRADPLSLLVGRPSAIAWSPLEHAGHVRDVIHALDIRLQRILREENPTLPETHVTPAAGANEQGPAVVLAALTVSADQLAGTIDHTRPESWTRSAQRAGATVTALDLVCEAVHEGTHHLKLAEEAIEALRDARAPASSSA